MTYYEKALMEHKKNRGKLYTGLYNKIDTMEDMSIVYTPGVAAPCQEIYKDKEKVFEYTTKNNTVAVVSNGTAVLGLGNIGPLAAIPVMEGKAALFKKFANINAVPLCIDETNIEKCIETIKNIAPCYGGINLEDIRSPDCFEIEKRLDEQLDIPVFHDDQHGTAIVVLAALFNALKVSNKDISNIKIVLNGPGSAGIAIIKMLIAAGAKQIIACDEYGILYKEREHMANHKLDVCSFTNSEERRGTLDDALQGADVFIGVSVANILKDRMIKSMGEKPIIFAMANPEPEISYSEAIQAGAFIVGTGRSDAPNQINNVLAFPGIFKGALEARATSITDKMKVSAAKAIADTLSEEEVTNDCIIPSVFDERVVENVSKAVIRSWRYR